MKEGLADHLLALALHLRPTSAAHLGSLVSAHEGEIHMIKGIVVTPIQRSIDTAKMQTALAPLLEGDLPLLLDVDVVLVSNWARNTCVGLKSACFATPSTFLRNTSSSSGDALAGALILKWYVRPMASPATASLSRGGRRPSPINAKWNRPDFGQGQLGEYPCGDFSIRRQAYPPIVFRRIHPEPLCYCWRAPTR